MIRVLFVDDEEDVLEGLENRLRRFRKRWKMSFSVGAHAALETLEADRHDVLVTDMKMPGMDGAELLKQVSERFPHMTRIVLSGQTDKEQVLQALPLAHDYLSKPCEVERLETAVQRGLNLQTVLGSAPVLAVISGIQRLPTVPRLFMALQALMDKESTSAADVADVVERDVSMTARILQVANSGFIGLGREVTAAREAVAYLGLNVVRSLVLMIELAEGNSDPAAPKGFSLEHLYSHSLQTAQLAARLLADAEQARTAFSAGLLHDIGSLVLATHLPDFWDLAGSSGATETTIPRHQAEAAAHGFTHAEVGGALLTLWGLPYSVVEGVTYHHTPEKSAESQFGVVAAVHVADRLVHENEYLRQQPGSEAVTTFDDAFIARVGGDEQLARCRSIANSEGNSG